MIPLDYEVRLAGAANPRCTNVTLWLRNPPPEGVNGSLLIPQVFDFVVNEGEFYGDRYAGFVYAIVPAIHAFLQDYNRDKPEEIQVYCPFLNSKLCDFRDKLRARGLLDVEV